MENTAKGVVHTQLINQKKSLLIHATFDFPITLVESNIQAIELKKGKIKLRKEEGVPTNLLDIYYRAKGNNCAFKQEFKIKGEDWDFITVRFIDADHVKAGEDLSNLSQKELEEIFDKHVSQSTVHYGDADEEKK